MKNWLLWMAVGMVTMSWGWEIDSDLPGTYTQIMSNQYVQETQEIDWKCITVEIQKQSSPSTINILKMYRPHGSPFQKANKTWTWNLPCKHNTTSGISICTSTMNVPGEDDTEKGVFLNYYVRQYYNNNTWVITTDVNQDPYSLYVWTRSVADFFLHDQKDIYLDLEQWEYTGPYHRPLLTFNPILCSL